MVDPLSNEVLGCVGRLVVIMVVYVEILDIVGDCLSVWESWSECLNTLGCWKEFHCHVERCVSVFAFCFVY
jgi:hypothetical protein